MKRLLSVLLCLVTCFCCSLTAFAGGPRTAEDIAAAGHTDNIAAVASLPSGLSVGTTYSLLSMESTDSELFMLNVWGGKDTDGAKIDMWKWDGTKEQRFRLISSGSYYKLEAVCSSSGRVLDAYRPLTNGCNVDLWSSNDNEAQELVIKPDDISGYVISLAYDPSLVLTAVDLSNDGAVQFKTNTHKNNQKWMFIESNDTLQRAPHPNCQNKKNWCWAAAAKMVAAHNSGGLKPEIDQAPQMLNNIDGRHKTYYGYGTINGTTKYFVDGAQYAIVKQIKGSDGDISGSVDDSVEALRHASVKEMDIGYIGHQDYELTDDTIRNQIDADLKDGKYIIGSMLNDQGQYGHSVVIMAYSDSDSNKTYHVFNPWDGSERDISACDLFHSYGYEYAGGLGRVSWFKYCREKQEEEQL